METSHDNHEVIWARRRADVVARLVTAIEAWPDPHNGDTPMSIPNDLVAQCEDDLQTPDTCKGEQNGRHT